MFIMTSQILKFGNSSKTQISISWEQNIFNSNKKNNSLYVKCYNMAESSLLAEVTFKQRCIVGVSLTLLSI